MKIIRKDTLKNGVKIQLEDWRDHNSAEYPNLYGLCIAAYPIAMNSGKYGMIRAHECFRLQITHNECKGYTNEDVKADYNALVTGDKALEDLAANFYNGEKDMWYLGMIPVHTNEWYAARIKYGI